MSYHTLEEDKKTSSARLRDKIAIGYILFGGLFWILLFHIVRGKIHEEDLYAVILGIVVWVISAMFLVMKLYRKCRKSPNAFLNYWLFGEF